MCASTLRQLTKLEATLLNLDKIACVNFLIVARVHGPLSEERLRTALRAVQQAHLHLQVRIRLADPPELVRDDALELGLRVLDDGRDDTWREVAEHELSQRFDFERGPLARAVLIRLRDRADLIVCFDHLWADATSGAHFVKDVLAACGGTPPEPGVVYEQQVHLDLDNFPANASGVGALPTKAAFVLQMLRERFLTPKRRLPPPSYLEIPDRGSIIVHRRLSEEETEALVHRCAAEETTVQGALCAALVTAFGAHLRTVERVRRPLLRCISVVNLRRYLRSHPSDAELGIYVGQLACQVAAGDPEQLWPLARDVIRRLRADLDRSLPFVVYRLLLGRDYASPEELMALFEATQPYVEVSNIGVLDHPGRYGDLRLESLHFASSQHFFQATRWGVNLFAATFGGRLTMNCQLSAGDWSRSEAAAILDRAIELLRS